MTYDISIDLQLSEAPSEMTAPPAAVRAEARALLDEVRRGLERDLEGARLGAERLLVLLSTRARPDERGGLAPWRKRRVEAFIREHITEPVLLDDLAIVADLSVSHFSRLFKQSFGCSPHAHIMRLRVEHARRLMLTTDEPLSQIALACGLSDQSHLSKLFRKVAGQSPRAWRRLNARPEEAAAHRAGGGPGAVVLTLERRTLASAR
jgi:AraC-like DNA-binding protein